MIAILPLDQDHRTEFGMNNEYFACGAAAAKCPEARDEQDSRAEQARKLEALGLLAEGIAHDFNALTVVLGDAGILPSEEGAAGDALYAIRSIIRAGTGSKDLASRLLDFSPDEQAFAPRAVNLSAELEQSRDLLARLIGEDTELHISPVEGPGDVLIDPTQLAQILMNLAANARDAMPDGGTLIFETSRVTVDDAYARQNPLAHPGEYVMLTVSGVDSATVARIFEPFFISRPEGTGTGLGLATVYGIVRQNGGFIDVCSEPEHGATFRIYFPRLGDGVAADTTSRVEDMEDKQSPPPRKGVILLVEDDQLVRTVTTDMLRFLDYEPVAARNASEAIALCRNPEVRIDLLMTDVVMPDMKGGELRDRVAEIRPDLPVLFTSGYTRNVIVRHGVLLQNVHFLQKPFNIEDLSAKIDELLARPDCPGSDVI